jgi:hypothetical protein
MPPEESETAFESTRAWLVIFFWMILSLTGCASYLLWALCHLIEVLWDQKMNGQPAPRITTFFFDYPILVMLFPLPWFVVAAWAVIRGRMAARNLILFSSSLILSLLVLAIFMTLVFTIPWIRITRAMAPA